MTGKIPQGRDELLEHLNEQIGFLLSSSKAYDDGTRAEAKRLAAILRVLLHDTSNSHSLLRQLDFKDTLDYCHVTGIDLSAGDPIVYCGVAITNSETGFEYVAKLGDAWQTTNFDEWWNGLVISNQVQGMRHNRSDVVLAVANQDGGHHVDPELRPDYAGLSRGNAFGWEPDFDNGPHLAIVRTVAHELELTLRKANLL